MAQLIQIGNSQGIRIPKPIIDQAQLSGAELELEIVQEGLLIKPKKKARSGWQTAIEETLSRNKKQEVDQEWLNAPLTDNREIEW
ncbi:AbrB/MazE/SpoVT family DNA-binding domain-containing protein [Ectothiorhodospiraceae bacterium BW-2]|nr:AbrB/MazE/SpoVT family DNA-binding domain-containing protein [Ectothiorhodospiraceae bacterium BW-2]